MTPPTLPRTARDVFRLTPAEWLLYNGLIRWAEVSGLWTYPRDCSGDLETMSLMDKVYWLYKAAAPVRRASRGAGLEGFFAEQERLTWSLPDSFDGDDCLRLSAAGDLMNHPYLKSSRDCLYADIEGALFGADISMANLECVVYPKASGSLSFSSKSGPPLYYDADDFEVATGPSGRRYTFVATANNHALDFGEAGVDSTLAALASHGVSTNGMNGRDADGLQATLIERSGFTIGVISHTFGLNANRPPSHRPAIVNRSHLNGRSGIADLSRLEEQIRYCHDVGVDLVVAHLHWGFEHEFYPRPDQIGVAHQLAEWGVDILIGHHPHVVQPVEYYRPQRDPERVVPIFYSLGNLINPFEAPYLRRSYLAQIEVRRSNSSSEGPRSYVRSAVAVPIVQENDAGSRTTRLKFA